MISFFPDINVWLALSFDKHSHSSDSWRWLNEAAGGNCTLLFSRYTQLGLLRLLTNQAVMGAHVLPMYQAWEIYDRWFKDPRIQFHPEPAQLEASFRHATEPFASQRASKWIGDCYLMAFAQEAAATLVTFDKALAAFASKRRYSVIVPD